MAGTALVQEARRLLAQTELSIRTVQRAERGDAGRLRIGFVAAVLFMDIREVVLGLERDLPGLESVWEEMGRGSSFRRWSRTASTSVLPRFQGVGDMRSIPVDASGW